MSAELGIDELLRQDEAERKAKRKRLKAFAAAVDDMRNAQAAASTLAEELIRSGDLSRNDLGKVFKLSRAEKTVVLPSRRSSAGDPEPDSTNTVAGGSEHPEQSNENTGQNSQD